jgi:hypothetical protein
LQNNVWVNLGGGSTWVSYRDRLERSIERALSEGFRIEAISFFDSMNPSSDVSEQGEPGWQEKPLAYIVLRATDPSIERVPSIKMDFDFIDQTGPVILAIESNSPAIDASSASGLRPVEELVVEQIVDVRTADDGEVTLEIEASGRGIIPELPLLLSGFDEPLGGFELTDDGLETHPFGVTDSDPQDSSRRLVLPGNEPDEEKTYAERDENGIYRQMMTRSWTLQYTPTGGDVGSAFTVPTLAAGVLGDLSTRHFADMDLIAVEAGSIPVHGGFGMTTLVLGGVVVLALVGFVVFSKRRGTREPARDRLMEMLPARDTPLGAIAALKRIEVAYGLALGDQRAALEADIAVLEKASFGRDSSGHTNGSASEVVDRWVHNVRTCKE